MSEYRARVVNITNNYRAKQCYLSATIALAQWIDEAVIVLDADEKVLYTNNRFGSFRDAEKRDKLTFNAMAVYLDSHAIYDDINILRRAVNRVYNDMIPAFVCVRLNGGLMVDFRVIPAIEDCELIGVVIIGCKRQERRSTPRCKNQIRDEHVQSEIHKII